MYKCICFEWRCQFYSPGSKSISCEPTLLKPTLEATQRQTSKANSPCDRCDTMSASCMSVARSLKS